MLHYIGQHQQKAEYYNIYNFTIKTLKLQVQHVSTLFWSSSESTHELHICIKPVLYIYKAWVSLLGADLYANGNGHCYLKWL